MVHLRLGLPAWLVRLSPDPAHDATQADHFARAAIECNSMEPMALAVHGQVASYLYKDFDLAFCRFEAALRINANAAPAWMWSAAAHAWMGDGPQALAPSAATSVLLTQASCSGVLMSEAPRWSPSPILVTTGGKSRRLEVGAVTELESAGAACFWP